MPLQAFIFFGLVVAESRNHYRRSIEEGSTGGTAILCRDGRPIMEVQHTPMRLQCEAKQRDRCMDMVLLLKGEGLGCKDCVQYDVKQCDRFMKISSKKWRAKQREKRGNYNIKTPRDHRCIHTS
jgi:hypothetical protein